MLALGHLLARQCHNRDLAVRQIRRTVRIGHLDRKPDTSHENEAGDNCDYDFVQGKSVHILPLARLAHAGALFFCIDAELFEKELLIGIEQYRSRYVNMSLRRDVACTAKLVK
jgi:hypothetical protein